MQGVMSPGSSYKKSARENYKNPWITFDPSLFNKSRGAEPATIISMLKVLTAEDIRF